LLIGLFLIFRYCTFLARTASKCWKIRQIGKTFQIIHIYLFYTEERMKKLFLTTFLLLMLASTQAFGLTIDVYNLDSQQAQIDNWINGRTTTALEDFESVDTGWYGDADSISTFSELVTGVGTFSLTSNTQAGIGSSSYDGPSDTTTKAFQVIESSVPLWGRENVDPLGGDRWLDSADVTELELTLSVQTNTLFFYLTDPSDIGATTRATSGIEYAQWDYQQSNGSQWFVGISSDDFIEKIVWSTTGNQDTNDGFGLDGFTAVSPVPEPTTMLLFGAGLLGLAGIGRKKFIK
jgi:hypothetical protein